MENSNNIIGPLLCDVKKIVYYNPDNNYTVLSVEPRLDPVNGTPVTSEDDSYIGGSRETLVGSTMDIREGDVITVYGFWSNSKYGKQIQITKCYRKKFKLDSLEALTNYLSSGLVKGVGRKTVEAIISMFGNSTVDTLKNNYLELTRVRGVSKKKAEDLHEAWCKNVEVNNILTKLQEYGLSSSYALKTYNTFEQNSVKNLELNPYCLTDVQGIGFRTADRVARTMGISMYDERRIKASVEYTFYQISNSGHVYTSIPDLVEQTNNLLGIPATNIQPVIEKMIETGDLVEDDLKVYLKVFYRAETGVADNLKRIMSVKIDPYIPNFENIEKKCKIQYDDTQKSAIMKAMSEKIMILTGGPGVGKSTTVNGILQAAKDNGIKILLAAPTGRAAKKLSEITGREAFTIHRLLKYTREKDGWKFEQNEKNPLEGDLLVVDESSMIDIMLMYSLVKAIPSEMRVIFVGDVDQLPSVGPGNVLRDMIDSGTITTVRLTNIFRQAATSRIITNAHLINLGQLPDIQNGGDFYFYDESDKLMRDPGLVAQNIINLGREVVKTTSFQPEDIQILTPMKKGPLGTININMLYQKTDGSGIYSGNFIKHGDYLFRKGDRVMQIKNNYDNAVYNGDIGIVDSIDIKHKSLTVDFSGNLIDYETAQLDELITAYAATIHKSQGSEYPVVIMPVTLGHRIMLQRNLIYTGITRAKKLCILVGSKEALEYAIKNNTVLKRNTYLGERLREE